MACEFCGEEHEGISEVEGLPVYGCPKIPPDCVYIDDEFDKGPRGRLFKLDELPWNDRR